MASNCSHVQEACPARAFQLDFDDPWILSHTLLPFVLVAAAQVPALLCVVLVYVWESLEVGLGGCVGLADAVDESPFESFVLDPLSGALGIGAALQLGLARSQRPLPLCSRAGLVRLGLGGAACACAVVAMWAGGDRTGPLLLGALQGVVLLLPLPQPQRRTPRARALVYVLVLTLALGLLPVNPYLVSLALHATLAIGSAAAARCRRAATPTYSCVTTVDGPGREFVLALQSRQADTPP